MRPYPPEAHPDTELAPHRPRALDLWVVFGLLGVWVALMSRFGDGDVYSVMGPYACAVTGVCFALSPRELLDTLSCDARGLLLGLGVGVVMTLLTYPAFDIATQLIPSLDKQVAALYRGADSTSLARALVWVAALVVAEEVLFRGVLPRALQVLTPPRTAFALAVLVYACAQLGSGSWIVFLLAIVCGTAWTLLRIYTGSLSPGLIAHGIWSPTLLLLYPVT